MLRIRIDLTAFQIAFKDSFWRLERNGIHHKTIEQYAAFLLREYGICGVRPVTYLDGTLLPDYESPLILKDGDLISLVPGDVRETQAVPIQVRNGVEGAVIGPGPPGLPPFLPVATSDTNVVVNGKLESASGEIESATCHERRHPQHDPVAETTPASAEETECSEMLPEGGVHKKRKRGKRVSRVRSKRVSFDLLENGSNDRDSAIRQMESTPFIDRVSKASIDEETDQTFDTRSEAYVTAVEETPGVSNRSKTVMKAGSARKAQKARSGLGFYLGMLANGSEENSIASSSSNNGVGSPRSTKLQPGPSNVDHSGDHADDGSQDALSVSTLEQSNRVSCDLGMFTAETSSVQIFPNVILEIVENNKEKKFLTVRHIQGKVPSYADSGEFKVDWGMLSSMKIL